MTTPSTRPVGRRPLLAATAAVAVGLTVPGLSSAAASAATRREGATPAATDSAGRPIPPSLARVLARCQAQIARHGLPAASTAPRAAGVRPIGDTIAADLPTRIAIDDTLLDFPFTVTTTTRYSDPDALVALVTAEGGLVAAVVVFGTAARQTTFRSELLVPSANVSTRGEAGWIVLVASDSDNQNDPDPSVTVLDTTIRIRSTIAQHVTRRGDTVSVFGAAKRFAGAVDDDAEPLYVAYPGHRVAVQRWTKQGWATLRTLLTDSSGHVGTTLTIPFTTGIRLYSPDTATTFGAATGQTVV